ncbi:MAG: helix-turn-helix domain-containing protein [Ruminococcaceae bacterium]|nr:helix-turn-helix domain-containing protein [Oscillospiraceae bacterium]
MEIGNKIKQLRNKSGLTQEQLATKLGISPQSVSKWETGTTMPDITLLPTLAGELGVTIDDLFDLTVEQKLHRIERRMDIEEEFSPAVFKEYEAFLQNQLDENRDKYKILNLLAQLYYHRILSYSRKVSKLARQAILLHPEKKECQWLLQKADGAVMWDWNVSNHTSVINFYKRVIENDLIEPKTPLPYYEIMDNLIADHRTKEAAEYLEIYRTLPAHKPFLIPVYQAAIALAEYNAPDAERIMTDAEKEFGNNSGFLFEKAQYHARKCEYDRAIEYYERSWEMDKKPRYTDALEAIAIINEIKGEKEKALDAYDRMIQCIKEDWNYTDEDAAVLEVQREKARLLSE